MATVKDIATAVGVSVATVSNVLNGRPNVGPATRRKVLQVARAAGLPAQSGGAGHAHRRTRAIGLVLPDLTNPFFPELAQAVENKARSLGLLGVPHRQPGQLGQRVGRFRTADAACRDGIIWCPLGPRLPASLKNLAATGRADRSAAAGLCVVHSNYEDGGRLLAQYALRMGHTAVSDCCPGRSI